MCKVSEFDALDYIWDGNRQRHEISTGEDFLPWMKFFRIRGKRENITCASGPNGSSN